MIPVLEYAQVAMDAAAPDGVAPIALTRAALEAKLKELGVSASSPLGRHALGGGRLWSKDGDLYQLDTAVSATSASAEPFVPSLPARTVPQPTLFDRVVALYCGDSKPQPATLPGAAPATSRQATSKGLLDRAADAWLGPVTG